MEATKLQESNARGVTSLHAHLEPGAGAPDHNLQAPYSQLR